MIITAKKLESKFKNKKVKINGNHPGNIDKYSHEGIFNKAWNVGKCIGFSAAYYTWTGIESWEENNGILCGYYTSAMYPDKKNSGKVYIELV